MTGREGGGPESLQAEAAESAKAPRKEPLCSRNFQKASAASFLRSKRCVCIEEVGRKSPPVQLNSPPNLSTQLIENKSLPQTLID